MKEWNLRLTETITFIRTANVTANPGLRILVADVLQHKYLPHIPQATSVAMSQGGLWDVTDRDTKKTNRKYRRAIVLIRSAILGVNAVTAATAAGLLPDVVLPGWLGGLLLTAEQHEQGLLQAQLAVLQANPHGFLTHRKISMQSTTTSGAMNYAFFHNLEVDRYDFIPPGSLNAGNAVLAGLTGPYRVPHITVLVHHVHVQGYLTVAGNLGGIVGTVLDNTDSIMVTTQLTGCSVVYQIQNTDMVAAHISPGGALGTIGRGYTLATTLRGAAGFANGIGGANVEVFGCQPAAAQRNYVPDRYTYLIGIKRAGQWELHAQQHRNTRADVPVTWQVEP